MLKYTRKCSSSSGNYNGNGTNWWSSSIRSAAYSFGIHPGTAHAWAKFAQASWTDYLAACQADE
jgi:hypothetical protein